MSLLPKYSLFPHFPMPSWYKWSHLQRMEEAPTPVSHLGVLFYKVFAMLKLHWEYIRKKRKGGIVYSFWYKLRLNAQCAQEPLDCPEKEGTCEKRRRNEEGLVDWEHPPHTLMSRNSSLTRRSVWEHKNGKNYDLKYLLWAHDLCLSKTNP